MRKKLIIVLVYVLYLNNKVCAQFKHYLSVNTVSYQSYFDKEKNKEHISSIWFFFPSLSYKLEKGRWGGELFYNDDGTVYYFQGNYYPDGERRINQRKFSSNIGLICHYTILGKDYIKVNPMLGLVKTWYRQEVWQLGLHSGGWWDGYVDGYAESKLGLLLGMNVNVPVYKGAYLNSNLRYSYFPTAQYSGRNLVWELGLGYMYQNKAKKKSNEVQRPSQVVF